MRTPRLRGALDPAPRASTPARAASHPMHSRTATRADRPHGGDHCCSTAVPRHLGAPRTRTASTLPASVNHFIAASAVKDGRTLILFSRQEMLMTITLCILCNFPTAPTLIAATGVDSRAPPPFKKRAPPAVNRYPGIAPQRSMQSPRHRLISNDAVTFPSVVRCFPPHHTTQLARQALPCTAARLTTCRSCPCHPPQNAQSPN